MGRRAFVGQSVLAALLIPLNFGGKSQSDPAPVRLAPPPLTARKVIEVTDAMLDNGPRDPSGRSELQLGQGDYVLKLPTDHPLTRKLQINGVARGNDLNNVARHIVIVGDAVHPRLNYMLSTMRQLDGSDFALYTQLGFTGAQGGYFPSSRSRNYVRALHASLTLLMPPKDDRDERIRDDSTSLFIADGTRSAAEAALPLLWDMEEVYVSRESLTTKEPLLGDADIKYLSRSRFSGKEQPDLKFRLVQSLQVRPKAGVGYQPPGYLSDTQINLALIQGAP
jgi:hypothetical protein